VGPEVVLIIINLIIRCNNHRQSIDCFLLWQHNLLSFQSKPLYIFWCLLLATRNLIISMNRTSNNNSNNNKNTTTCVCQEEEDSSPPDNNGNGNGNGNGNDNDDDDVISLRFLSNPIAFWIEPIARAFEESKQGSVRLTFVQVPFTQLFPDIINEARTGAGLFDGFLSPPSVSGSIAEYSGWADLRPFIQSTAERLADWSDILLGYRQAIAQYQDQIIMYPLDGDVHTMYYRKDVLKHWGLPVPRTWDEYVQVAAATHGTQWNNRTLAGSCIGRAMDCAGPYWANLLLSSLTQTAGASTGHLFDTTTSKNSRMQPLTGPALQQALRWMVAQVQYGATDEFESCLRTNTVSMAQGTCVLTYNWGNTFKQQQ
jgi:ABC-type glycerol-3-phosphate transport system substrate-binding protein